MGLMAEPTQQRAIDLESNNYGDILKLNLPVSEEDGRWSLAWWLLVAEGAKLLCLALHDGQGRLRRRFTTTATIRDAICARMVRNATARQQQHTCVTHMRNKTCVTHCVRANTKD